MKAILPALLCVACLALGWAIGHTSLNPSSPARYVWVTGLRPEKAAYYKNLHAHPWPGVLQTITACHIRDFSIHETQIGGKPYLIAYLEYAGNDFDADMKKMAADPETQRWWKETDPCQDPLPDAKAKGKIWSDTEEVFHEQ